MWLAWTNTKGIPREIWASHWLSVDYFIRRNGFLLWAYPPISVNLPKITTFTIITSDTTPGCIEFAVLNSIHSFTLILKELLLILLLFVFRS